MNEIFNSALPYILAIIFTAIASLGRPNGAIMAVNIVIIPIVLLALLFNASPLSRPDHDIALGLGGMFDYRLFTSVKWWIQFLPISVMAIRMAAYFTKAHDPKA